MILVPVKTTSQEVLYGERVNVPDKLSRKGYTFTGWTIDGENIVTPSDKMGTEDVIYRALWKPNVYTIKYEKNKDTATGEMPSTKHTYDVGNKTRH